MAITAAELRDEIAALPGVATHAVKDGAFFFYDPDQMGDRARMFPMATIVTSDVFDGYSDLDRDGVFRLNLGIDRETFLGLFGAKASAIRPDYTQLDVVMPHPEYGNSYFICVLSPDTCLPQVRTLIARAREVAASRYPRKPAA